MIVLLPIMALVLGLLFAWLASERIQNDGIFAAPAFTLVCQFMGIAFYPFSLYLLYAHSIWSFLGWDGVNDSFMAAVMIALGVTLFGLLGWYAGGTLIRKRQRPWLIRSIIGTSVVFVAFLLLLNSKLLTISSAANVEEFGLFDIKLGYVLVVLLTGLIISAAFVGMELTGDSKRSLSRQKTDIDFR